MLSATDAEGNTTTYAYDQNGNVKTATDSLGTKTITNYDFEDRPKTITEADGTTDERVKAILNRDKMGNPLQVQDYNGNVTTTEYNALYLPAKVFDPSPFNAHYSETTYYKTGKVKSIRNRRGYISEFEYDALNREKKVTDPLAKTIETTYDKVGNVKTRKDKRGILTENFYDSLYRLTKTERAETRLITNEYDDAGNKSAVIDANNNQTGFAYNNRNLLVTTTYADSTTDKRTYDGVGNVLTNTNEENTVTTFTYDKENRQLSAEFAGEKTEKTYDEVGNLVLFTKPKQNKQKMDYDRLKRLTAVTDDPSDPATNYVGLNLKTRYEYDANGNLRHQYDARNNHVEYAYDALNRKTKHVQYKAPSNLVTFYTSYDEEGNLTVLTDPKGQNFTYAYDELNRRTDETYPTNTLTPYLTTASVHTDYDANNNVTGIIETKATTTNVPVTDTNVNVYDDFDRLTRNTQRGTLITYGYDSNGNRTLVSSPSGSTSYTFNSRNRLEIVSDGTSTTAFTYYPDGKNDTVVYPNGTDVKYTYWPTNRVESVVNKVTASGSVISSYAYEYDGNGNRTSQIEVQDGTTETTAYTYDTLDRMKTFTFTGSGNATLNEYTFEGYNRKTEKVTQNGVVTAQRTYTYDETDWLTKLEDSTNARKINYTYDKNGNTMVKTDSLSPDQNKNFVYDSLNRLVQTKGTSNNVLGLYDYNAAGMRIRHRSSDRGDVDYFYDGRSVIDEYDASNNSFMVHYNYADRLLSLTSLNGIQYYHHDGLGSTVNLSDMSGATQVSYNLDPWGHIRRQAGYSINRHIFTGKEHDLNTGLIYFGARYYDADTARFITQDTYLGEPGTPPSMHRYLYAYSNPTVNIDLNGNCVWDLCIGEGAAIVALSGVIATTANVIYQELTENKDLSQVDYTRAGVFGAATAGIVYSGGTLGPLATGGLISAGAGYSVAEQTLVKDRSLSEVSFEEAYTSGGFFAGGGAVLGPAMSSAKPLINYGARAVALGLSAGAMYEGGQNVLEGVEAGKGGQAAFGVTQIGLGALGTFAAFKGGTPPAKSKATDVYLTKEPDVKQIEWKISRREAALQKQALAAEGQASDRTIYVNTLGEASFKKPMPTALIGENQKRLDVEAAARRANGEQVETITDWLNREGRAWSEPANKEWAEMIKREGYDVNDIGPDFERRLRFRIEPSEPGARPPSKIYGNERKTFNGYPKYQRQYNRNGKYNVE